MENIKYLLYLAMKNLLLKILKKYPCFLIKTNYNCQKLARYRIIHYKNKYCYINVEHLLEPLRKANFLLGESVC